jgi:hypothetical protein
MVVPTASLSWAPARRSRKRRLSATVAFGRYSTSLRGASRCSNLPSAAICLRSWREKPSATSGPSVAFGRGEADAEEASDPARTGH